MEKIGIENILCYFDLVISYFRIDIFNKEIKLKYYEEKFELFKRNFPQNLFKRSNSSFNELINKLKQNNFKIIQ